MHHLACALDSGAPSAGAHARATQRAASTASACSLHHKHHACMHGSGGRTPCKGGCARQARLSTFLGSLHQTSDSDDSTAATRCTTSETCMQQAPWDDSSSHARQASNKRGCGARRYGQARDAANSTTHPPQPAPALTAPHAARASRAAPRLTRNPSRQLRRVLNHNHNHKQRSCQVRNSKHTCPTLLARTHLRTHRHGAL